MTPTDRRHLLLGLGVLALLTVASYLSVIAIHGIPFSNPYKAEAVVGDGAPLLKDGDEVRVGGQRAGQVRDVTPTSGGALVKLDLDDGPIGAGAQARVRLRGLAGATYVEIDRGDTSRPLAAPHRIPLARTSFGVDLQDVVEGFPADARRALGRDLSRYGGGLTTTGRHVNAALADLPPTLGDLTPELRAFTPQRGALADMLGQAGRVTRAAAPPGSRDLGGLVTGGADVFATTAGRSGELGDALERARPFEDAALRTLPVADPLLARTTFTARRLTPAVEAVDAALPALNRALSRRSALSSLTAVARRGRPLLRVARPLITELRPGARSLAPLASATLPLAAYMNRYPQDLFLGPYGFTRWGGFKYDQGQAKGHRAVRFAPVFTCGKARDAFPKPNAARDQESPPCAP